MVGIYADGKTSITAGCYSSEQTDKVMDYKIFVLCHDMGKYLLFNCLLLIKKSNWLEGIFFWCQNVNLVRFHLLYLYTNPVHICLNGFC